MSETLHGQPHLLQVFPAHREATPGYQSRLCACALLSVCLSLSLSCSLWSFRFCCYMLFFALAHLVFMASFHLSESTTEPGLAFCSLGTRWHLVTRSDYSLGMRNDE